MVLGSEVYVWGECVVQTVLASFELWAAAVWATRASIGLAVERPTFLRLSERTGKDDRDLFAIAVPVEAWHNSRSSSRRPNAATRSRTALPTMGVTTSF